MESIYNKHSLIAIRLSIDQRIDEYGTIGAYLAAVSDESGVYPTVLFSRMNGGQIREARMMLVGLLDESGMPIELICALMNRRKNAIYRLISRHKELLTIYCK